MDKMPLAHTNSIDPDSTFPHVDPFALAHKHSTPK